MSDRTEREPGLAQILAAIADRCRLPRAEAGPRPPLPAGRRGGARGARARRRGARPREAGLALPLGGVGTSRPTSTGPRRGASSSRSRCASARRSSGGARTRGAPRGARAEAPRCGGSPSRCPPPPHWRTGSSGHRAVRRDLRPGEPRARRGARARPRLHRALRPTSRRSSPTWRCSATCATPTSPSARALRAAGARERALGGARHRAQRLASRADPVRRARLDGGARERALDRERGGGRGGAAHPQGADLRPLRRLRRARARPRGARGARRARGSARLASDLDAPRAGGRRTHRRFELLSLRHRCSSCRARRWWRATCGSIPRRAR